jgi:two-component system, LytTR family, response regulator
MLIFKKKSSISVLRTIIIDDEAHQRLTIEKMVGLYCPDVELIGKADGVKSGMALIKKAKPDLVLLDIKMDDGTGFDLLDRLQPIDFKVIFITAYDEYAVKAFRFNALDYLLKPLDPDELVQAIDKARGIIQKDFLTQLENLREHLSMENKSNKKIIIKTFDNIHLVPIEEILYCESDRSYTTVYILNHQKIVASTYLKDYEEMLSGSGFFRVHKSYLINLRLIRRFEKSEGGYVVLEGDVKIPVASRKREQLLEMFEKLT